MLILGLNAYHGDSSACLVRDGVVVAAAEEERFTRVKHWAGFPEQAIRWCLQDAGAGLADLHAVAINRDPKANFLKKLGYVFKKRPELKMIVDRVRNQRKVRSVAEELESRFHGQQFTGKQINVEHHLCHVASAFLVSPFDRAVCVSVDGFGDFASAAWGLGSGTNIDIDGRVLFPHSLGIFYQAMTQYLGFPHYGDEYKVMGLAPYGKPSHMDALRKVVKLQPDGSFELDTRFFRHTTEKITYEWEDGSPAVGTLFSSELEELLGPARTKDQPLEQLHRDLAHSTQAIYEEAFFHLLDALHSRYGGEQIALAGGCAMNSVANGKIARRSKFREAYIQSAAGDAGGAIGAAMWTWHRESGGPRQPVLDHAYLGPSFEADDYAALLDESKDELARAACTVTRIDDNEELCRRTATAIARGDVVGWFQGRMEWGPRALGNRSIVCDPRRADMKDILNRKIKRRESFRPFAPSILREQVAAWFEEDAEVPFMMKVFQIRPERRVEIPAVTHADGSGRLQTVYRHTNPLYHQLISAFADQTGVPLVLNTSFNENEPVVCHPREALACFLRTRMDVLVLGPFLVERSAEAE